MAKKIIDVKSIAQEVPVFTTLDPGKDGAFAHWKMGKLNHAGMLDSGEWREEPPYELLIAEQPVIYPNSPVPPSDVVTLALTAGAQAEKISQGGKILWVTAREWKGQIPKAVHHKRAIGALSGAEMAYLELWLSTIPESKRHNVIDAVALGLWALDRI